MKKLQTIKYFSKNGFAIIDLWSGQYHRNITQTINKKINILIKSSGNDCGLLDDLKDYHKLNMNDDFHSQLMQSSNRLISEKYNFNFLKKNTNLCQIMEHCWGHSKYRLIWVGALSKHEIVENHCAFRIARPGILKDAGSVHLDKNYGGQNNDEKDCLLTLWVPIVGFDERYTLKIAPESHRSSHFDLFIQEDKNYISLTYDKSYTDNFNFIRPKLKLGQGIIFHPNLLHGSSYNDGVNTRVALQFLLFNGKKAFDFDSNRKKSYLK